MAIKLVNGNKNININNVFVENPRLYGPLFIANQDFNTPQITENIYANNLKCLNCSGDVTKTSDHLIMIEQIDTNQAGVDVMNNININNFNLDGSPAAGIYIFANKADIKNLKLTNGIINGTNNAGIRITGNYNLINSVIDGVTFSDNGVNPQDNTKRTGIEMTNTNITNLQLRNNNFYNNSGVMLSRYTLYANNMGNMSIIGNNNRGYALSTDQYYVNTRVGSIIYSFDDEVYTGAIADSGITTCDTNEKTRANDGRTLFNSTTSCTCTGGAWKCTNFDY
jgi:hypothetical protein